MNKLWSFTEGREKKRRNFQDSWKLFLVDGHVWIVWRYRNVFIKRYKISVQDLFSLYILIEGIPCIAGDINISQNNYDGKITKTSVQSVPGSTSKDPEIIYGKPVTSSRPSGRFNMQSTTQSNLQDGFVPSSKNFRNAITTAKLVEPMEPVTQKSHVSR